MPNENPHRKRPEEMRQLVWLDLCSGLGGASQPALDRGWKVIRVDIDPRFKPDIVADVRALPFDHFARWKPDVLWASPPCQDFSKWGMRHFYPNPPEPDLSIVRAIAQYVWDSWPPWWVVENVRSSRQFINPILGYPQAVVPGHVFWGKLPTLIPQVQPHKQAPNRKFGTTAAQFEKAKAWWAARGKSPQWTGHNGLSAAEAAKIPYEIGEAICRAVEARSE